MTETTDILVFPLAQLGQAFSTRDRGLRALADLQSQMLKADTGQVIVDFGGVRTVSYSFADGFFGKLAQRAADAHLDPPQAKNLAAEVREQVVSSLADRGLSLHQVDEIVAA
jgi:hypothetical protein